MQFFDVVGINRSIDFQRTIAFCHGIDTLSGGLKQLKERIDTLERRYVVLNEITKSQYDFFMPELKAKQREQEVKMALGYACNLPSLWKLGDLKTKRTIQYMVFSDGIGYDFKNKLVRTFRVNEIFGAISLFTGDLKGKEKGDFHSICRKSPLVTSPGIEPGSKV